MEEKLREVARLREMLRLKDAEIAAHFNVSRRTILRWVADAEYPKILQQIRLEQKESARSQISGLAEDVIAQMQHLMHNSRSDFVKYQSARTLGEWMGLHLLEQEDAGDERDEALQTLKMLLNQPQRVVMLPPPLPGGAMPRLEDGNVVEGIIIENTHEKEG